MMQSDHGMKVLPSSVNCALGPPCHMAHVPHTLLLLLAPCALTRP
jgi:hypothetical protein